MWHLSLFEPGELVRIAMELEKRGVTFYRQLAQKTVSSPVKDLLELLASEEEQHQLDFAALGGDFEPVDPRESYSGEYLDYVRSLVETHIFNDLVLLERMVSEAQTEKEVLRLAARLEKETILFFISMGHVIKPEKRQVVDDLIAQEEGHLAKIGRLLKEIR